LRVSIIVEGDNEKHCPKEGEGSQSVAICLGLEGLLQQDFPLNEAELILVGTEEQTARWALRAAQGSFARIQRIAAPGEDYFEMKMAGRHAASAPILAVVDSDVFPKPQWLSTLVSSIEEKGADAAAGLTRLQWHGVAGPDSALMTCIGAISWGAITHRQGEASGFHANNVGLRGDLLDALRPSKGLLRACAAHQLADQWLRSGKRIRFDARQCVIHAFSPDWWSHMHARSGREAMLLRRMFLDWPHRWVTRLGWLEPLFTFGWRVLCDTPQWWRYAANCGWSPTARALTWPMFILVSVATRGVELCGAYTGLLSNEWNDELRMHLESPR